MVHWLGGEWGVVETSDKVVNPRLPLEERRRHMDTASRIDIMARTGIITCLPLGLHMGHLWGLQPLGGPWLVAMWRLRAAWMALSRSAFAARGTPRFRPLSNLGDWTRDLLIPTLPVLSLSSLAGLGPLPAGPDAALEARLARSIAIGRSTACLCWVLILTTAFPGAVKPL